MTTPYEDELLYSVLARDYIRSGCVNYRNYAKQIYEEPIKKAANIEFLNPLKEDIKKQLEAYQPIEDYTMYGFYSMFMDSDKKGIALKAVQEAEGYYYKHLPIPAPKNGQKRYLRYCPQCAKEDRERYGETYWHKSAQMAGIDICHKHGCYLCDSQIEITGNKKEDLYPAELCAINSEVQTGTDIGWKLAKYTNDLIPAVSATDIRSLLDGTKYVVSRQVNKKILLYDITKYFCDVRVNPYLLTEEYQMDKILKGVLIQPVMICQILMFLA